MARSTFVSLDIAGTKQLSAMQQLLDPKAFDKAIRSGVSYATKSVPPATAKAISSRYTITSTRVKAAISAPAIRGTGLDLQATMRISRQPPTVLQFKARQRGPDLVHSLFKGQATVTRHGFIGIARGQRLPLYPVRSKPYGPDLSSGRTKPRPSLDVVHAPSIGSIAFGKSLYGPQIEAEIKARIIEQFQKGVDRQFKAASRGFG